MKKRIIVGITGASGSIYAVNFIRKIAAMEFDVHVVVSEMGEQVFQYETGESVNSFLNSIRNEMSSVSINLHDIDDMFSVIASGSYSVSAMVILPCSMKTVAALANGFSSNLLERAGDVMMKERRPLVVVSRESPVSSIHLKNMLTLSDAGAVIMPASPGFYSHPKSIDDLADFMTGKILNSLSIDHDLNTSWKGRD